MSDRDETLANHPDGTCLDCGGPLQAVRPGKEQCDNCDGVRHLQVALEEVAKLAATLKRERDEARADATNYYARTGELEAALSYGKGTTLLEKWTKAIEERDEARRLIAALHEDQATLILERDRLRQQLATQAESTSHSNPTRHSGRVEKTEQDLQP